MHTAAAWKNAHTISKLFAEHGLTGSSSNTVVLSALASHPLVSSTMIQAPGCVILCESMQPECWSCKYPCSCRKARSECSSLSVQVMGLAPTNSLVQSRTMQACGSCMEIQCNNPRNLCIPPGLWWLLSQTSVVIPAVTPQRVILHVLAFAVLAPINYRLVCWAAEVTGKHMFCLAQRHLSQTQGWRPTNFLVAILLPVTRHQSQPRATACVASPTWSMTFHKELLYSAQALLTYSR